MAKYKITGLPKMQNGGQPITRLEPLKAKKNRIKKYFNRYYKGGTSKTFL